MIASTQEALSELMRHAPCAHPSYDDRIGVGGYWVRCHDCGESTKRDRLEHAKQSAQRFDEAIALLRSKVTS